MPVRNAAIQLFFALGLLCNCSSHMQMPDIVPATQAQTPVAPPPPRLGDGTWKSADGEIFSYTKWLPEGGAEPEMVIIGVHGLSGAAEDYRPMGAHFEKTKKAVYSYELRGQGKDPVEKRRGDIKSPDLWFADLNTFIGLVRREHPGKPLFLYGESMGSLIVTHAQAKLAADNRAALRGIILASPIVAFKEKLPPLKNFIVHLLIKITPWIKISLGNLAGDEQIQVTTDTNHEEQMAETAHFVSHFSFRLLGYLEEMIEDCQEATSRIKLPLLILYPGHDYFTDTSDVETFFQKLQSTDKVKYLFAESFHLLLHDKESESVLEKLSLWLEEKAKPAGE